MTSLEDVPASLQFELDDRPAPADRDPEDQVSIALGGTVYTASKPSEYTFLLLGGAMSGMAEGVDRAYAMMVFIHDSFDGNAREAVKRAGGAKLFDIINGLCQHWGQDTSDWVAEPEPNNRAERRRKPAKKAVAKRS